MNWKLGDILVHKETNLCEIRSSFTFYENKKQIYFFDFFPSICEELLDRYFRHATPRETFLYYIGVRKL